MNVMQAICDRRSIRAYLPKKVEQEKLEKILEAGRLSPSAMNSQERKIVLITNPKIQATMVEASGGQNCMATAPASIAVIATSEVEMPCGVPARIVDASIAMSFMMLEAIELGLGTCWIGGFSQQKAMEALDLPEGWRVIAFTPIGYPAEEPVARPRKTPEETIIRK